MPATPCLLCGKEIGNGCTCSQLVDQNGDEYTGSWNATPDGDYSFQAWPFSPLTAP